MTTAQKYFMVVVQEQSLARAAERLLLSQQNLGNHISRLEAEYGRLFYRRPQFALTPAGEALYQTLQQIRVLERGLDQTMRELKQDQHGTLRLGIFASRARAILPQVLANYRQKFPHVRLELFLQDTDTSLAMLRDGELDLFLGIDPPVTPEFVYIPLLKESIYMVAPPQMLEEQGVSVEGGMIARETLPRFRYLLNPPISHLRQKIDAFLQKNGLCLHEAMRVGDFELQLMLCAQGEGACFCAQMMLPRLRQINLDLPPERELWALRVEGLTQTNEVSLVIHRLTSHTGVLDGFVQAIQAVLCQGEEGLAGQEETPE